MFDRLFQLADRLMGYNPFVVLVELALIGAVVYMILRFLRGTRGARVLKGVGLVIVIALLLIAALGAENISFTRLRFLLENFIGFASLALVIVFQPELRRALMRLGEARLFRGPAVMQFERVVDEVLRAVTYLSKNKIGAIIAIEREQGLKGVVEAGTQLDAEVSAELLKTVFWPGSALHDMGVVITGDRVTAAGVQFPLASAEELSQELGSRHRAAVGLSQEADCLVIVISEETGAISLAERGQLVRRLTPDGLRAMLRRALVTRPETKRSGGLEDMEGDDRDADDPTGDDEKKADKSAA